MSEHEEVRLFEDVRIEAEAIVKEAKDQALLLLEAAERRRESSDADTDKIRSAGLELALSIEKSIALLTGVLDELRASLD
ncbi:MAG TPA: hypothetical protein VNA87_06835 [Actinomycetota bacterium]|nr:hypothetical protein [Actinomycetota bacterium]